jgi:hypothetical protein
MGTEEEPDQKSRQRHGQLRPVYLGYFEDEGGGSSDSKRGSDCEHAMCIRPGISLASKLSFQYSSRKLVSSGINMAKRCSQTSLASSKVIVRESNKPVHAASADTGRSDTANRHRRKVSRLIHAWQYVSRSVSFCRAHTSKRVGRLQKPRRGGIVMLSR